MKARTIAGFAAALALALTPALAAAIGGVSGLGGAGSMVSMGSFNSNNIGSLMVGGRGGFGASAGAVGSGRNGLAFFPFPTNDPNHYHEIKLIGRLAKDESGLTVDQQIVRMRVDGRSIPMSINGDLMSNSLQFDQGDELGQTLYRLILSKQLEVVGDQKLRAQIASDAAASPSKQVLVDGFVYDRMTPYLVLVAVHDAP